MAVVVVGAGLGGLRVVEQLRRRGFSGAITLVGGEQHPPYDRPPLTKQVLRGETDDTTLRTDLESLDIDLRLGVRAATLDAGAREIALADGTALPYEQAVLAPGAVARTLPGARPRPGLHVVRTIDDARALRDAVRGAGRVAVVGGGFVGCEVAASAVAMGAEVDLVEILTAPLVRVLGDTGAQVATSLLEARGVRVHCGVGVEEVLGEDRVRGLRLGNGTVLDVGEVVVGLGVTPDVGWLDGSRIDLEDGIVCDAGGRTSLPAVFAVGDAARWFHPLVGEHRRVEHWTTTADQASVVAANIAAGPGSDTVVSEDVPYFWSDLFDVKVQALGFLDGGHDVRTLTPNGRTVLLYSDGGRLTGVVGFSAARSVMKLRPLVAAGAPVEDAVALLA